MVRQFGVVDIVGWNSQLSNFWNKEASIQSLGIVLLGAMLSVGKKDLEP